MFNIGKLGFEFLKLGYVPHRFDKFHRCMQPRQHPILTQHFDHFENTGAHGRAGKGDPHRLGDLAEAQAGFIHHAFKGALLGLFRQVVQFPKLFGKQGKHPGRSPPSKTF